MHVSSSSTADSSGDASTIRLVLVGATDAWRVDLQAALSPQLSIDITAVDEATAQAWGAMALGSPQRRAVIECDVALPFLSSRSLQPLTAVLAMHQQLGYPEIVAVVESANDTAALALQDLGLERVIPLDSAATWLLRTLRPLATMAAAKRSLRRSREELGELRPLDPLTHPDIVPLAVAESRFREAYLRVLMARTGSRLEASERARVAYRTLCYMLERYEIAEPTRPESSARRRTSSRARTNDRQS